jgi:prefoldin subunit 5
MTAEFAPCGVPLIGTNCQKHIMQCEIESLRASLTRVEEERDRLQETLDAIESAAEDRRFD